MTAIPRGGERIREREITEPVALCLPDGRLNPDAVGWARGALHDTRLPGWGRNKRFEYWSVQTPSTIFTMNISHHDYRANVSITCIDRSTWSEIVQGGNTWMPRRGGLDRTADREPMQARRKDVLVRMTPTDRGTLLHGRSARIDVDVEIVAPDDHESMAVVVPWSDRRFQYTKKDNGLRAVGLISVDGIVQEIDAEHSIAVHDRGRGRWPYFTLWNWGAGNGVTADGQALGLQFGGKWTDGTPSTENWIRLDGRLHKVSSHLEWRYDPADWTAPWRLVGPSVEVTFTPERHLRHVFDRWIVKSRGDTCFGTYAGTVELDDGRVVAFADVFGHVEEVERRW
ncbi:DUF2804 domain-containing protein [Agromyces sp. G08B096]|uniref:DUF2804 domain-containing protein n=1 Tax=Agromyces sp. G08B096 TaxID=3156399 RepID=A0AAU7W8R2_9MICO